MGSKVTKKKSEVQKLDGLSLSAYTWYAQNTDRFLYILWVISDIVFLTRICVLAFDKIYQVIDKMKLSISSCSKEKRPWLPL